jgi:hypothetical protein
VREFTVRERALFSTRTTPAPSEGVIGVGVGIGVAVGLLMGKSSMAIKKPTPIPIATPTPINNECIFSQVLTVAALYHLISAPGYQLPVKKIEL